MTFTDPINFYFADLFSQNRYLQNLRENIAMSYPIDIYYDNDGCHLEIAVTGRNKDEIEVVVEGDKLCVKADSRHACCQHDDKESHRKYVVRRISRKDFSIALTVPPQFDIDKLTTNMSNGCLDIFIPTASDCKPRKIAING